DLEYARGTAAHLRCDACAQMGRCPGGVRGQLRRSRRFRGGGRTVVGRPAGRSAHPGLPAAADRDCEGIAGADRSAGMSSSSRQPLRLLLSAFAHGRWGERILAAVPAGALSLVTAEEALAAGAPCDADIAFMTREVTGKSSSN